MDVSDSAETCTPDYSHVERYVHKLLQNSDAIRVLKPLPGTMAQLDVVVIFDGSDVPFVIRGTLCYECVRWKLVGECYVSGWMDGTYSGHEVMDDVDLYLAMADAEPDTDFSYSKKTLLSEFFVLC
jgi:hypothetical protein